MQNLAAKSHSSCKNKPIGTERVPKGHQKSAKGRTKYIKKIGPEQGERNKRERRGMGGGRTWNSEALLAPLGRVWVPILAPTGSRRVDPLGGCFSMYLVLPQKIEKRTFVNNYTAKVGDAKYIEKR